MNVDKTLATFQSSSHPLKALPLFDGHVTPDCLSVDEPAISSDFVCMSRRASKLLLLSMTRQHNERLLNMTSTSCGSVLSTAKVEFRTHRILAALSTSGVVLITQINLSTCRAYHTWCHRRGREDTQSSLPYAPTASTRSIVNYHEGISLGRLSN